MCLVNINVAENNHSAFSYVLKISVLSKIKRKQIFWHIELIYVLKLYYCVPCIYYMAWAYFVIVLSLYFKKITDALLSIPIFKRSRRQWEVNGMYGVIKSLNLFHFPLGKTSEQIMCDLQSSWRNENLSLPHFISQIKNNLSNYKWIAI